MKLELRPHPHKVLRDDGTGTMVPCQVIFDVQTVWSIDGAKPKMLAYCGNAADKPVSFPWAATSEAVRHEVLQFVADEVGPPSGWSQAPMTDKMKKQQKKEEKAALKSSEDEGLFNTPG